MKGKKISIIGLGWLGLPLAKALSEQGYAVKGTVTSEEKARQLTEEFPGVSILRLNADDIQISNVLIFDCDILLINIPPRRVPGIENIYPAQIGQLLPYIHAAGIRQVLFVSSTSVYPEVNREVDENERSEPSKASGLACLRAEELLQIDQSFHTTILRFGGLIGPGRQPYRFMQYGVSNRGGNIPVNLIHLDDCLGIIQHIVEKELWGEVFNACCPEHPTRREFYTTAAKAAEVEIPLFTDEEDRSYKEVSCQKLISTDYKFRYNSPLHFFN